MQTELLLAVLAELQGATPDITAAAVLRPDGTVLACAGDGAPPSPQRLGMLCGSALTLAERTTRLLERGPVTQLLVRATGGYVLLLRAGPQAVLTVLCQPSAKLGLVWLDAGRAAEAITRVL